MRHITPSPDRAAPWIPRRLGRGQLVGLILAALLVAGLVYGLIPRLPELRSTLTRLEDGELGWLVLAFVLELLSFGSYVVVFHQVFSARGSHIGWRASYDITMAGVVATRLLATAGAGGIGLTAWALSRAGLPAGEVRRGLAAFLVFLYAVFLATLVLAGMGLWSGLLTGPAPVGLTLIPALGAGAIVATALVLALFPPEPGRREHSRLGGTGRAARGARAVAAVPATVSAGVRGALALVRSPSPGLLGAVGWWGFDIAVLWSCLHAFGAQPPAAVVVVAYFVGMAGNLLPTPGGIGGVEGGMVAALIGFGVGGGPAILGVLAYRAFAFWLPILPGVASYLVLLRSAPLRENAPQSRPEAVRDADR